MSSRAAFGLALALSLKSGLVLAQTDDPAHQGLMSHIPPPSVQELTEDFDTALDFRMRMEHYPDNPEAEQKIIHAIFVHTIIPEGSYGATGGGPFSYCSEGQRTAVLLDNLDAALQLTTNENIDKQGAAEQIQEARDFCFPETEPGDELIPVS